VSGFAFQARHLSVDLGGARILDDISFDIISGGRVAIIGPNGAGKTTLLRVLAGLSAPSAGEILVEGRPASAMGPRERARRIAYVPQMTEKTMPCRVGEFVLLSRYAHGRHAFGSADAADRDAARRAMESAGVAGFADRDLSTLSGGERQKVLVAAALAQEAPILLLDEPAAFLDYRRQLELATLLDTLPRPLTIVSVVHDLSGGAMEGDLVIALAGGRIIFAGAPAELAETGLLEQIYGVEFELIRSSARGRTLVIPVGLRRDRPEATR